MGGEGKTPEERYRELDKLEKDPKARIEALGDAKPEHRAPPGHTEDSERP